MDDPYEEPMKPELTLHTVETSPEENARIIMQYLEDRGFIQPDSNNSEDHSPDSQSVTQVAAQA